MSGSPQRRGGAGRSGRLGGRRVPGTERGSGTVLLLGVVGAVLVLAWGGLVLGAAVVATHRARAAADLAALAGAAALGNGASPAEACARSEPLAERNGARLTSCRAEEGGVLAVVTSTRAALVLPGTPGLASGTARAGPAP